MNKDFSANRLKKQMSGATAIKAAFGILAKKISMRLDEIEAAPNLGDFCRLPGPKCHSLTGPRTGDWAVDLSGNYRLIFEINQEPIPLLEDGSINRELVTSICIKGVEDYH